MPARYVLGLNRNSAEEAASAWAESHASAAGVPLVRVHVSSKRDAVAARSGPPTSTDVVLPPGPVPQALARFVEDDDVLVIGTGKTGFIHGRVFGTMGFRIASAVRCTVAVIPQLDLRFRSGIIAGVKDDDLLERIVRAASAEAVQSGEPLQILHSSFAGIVPAPVETAGSAIERADSLVSRLAPRAMPGTRETARPPAEALLDASRNAALIVTGTGHPHGGERSVGPVVQDILVNINAPVLIVPARPADPTA